jgi:hypothetical protein
MSEQPIRKVKLCPFRKEILVTDAVGPMANTIPTRYEEGFMECLGEKCIAYCGWLSAHNDILYDNCMLVKK